MTTRSKQMVAMAKKKANNLELVSKPKNTNEIPSEYQTALEKCQQYVNKLPKKISFEQVARTEVQSKTTKSISSKRKAEESVLPLENHTIKMQKIKNSF